MKPKIIGILSFFFCVSIYLFSVVVWIAVHQHQSSDYVQMNKFMICVREAIRAGIRAELHSAVQFGIHRTRANAIPRMPQHIGNAIERAQNATEWEMTVQHHPTSSQAAIVTTTIRI